nr:uncharacterized protein LOC124809815 [Hydra vulgaris]
MMSEYFKSLKLEEAIDYTKKLTLKNGEVLSDPFIIEPKEWSNDLNHLPNITWQDVTQYLIDTPSIYTKESIRAYKSLEAFDYFTCGHVQECFYNKISNRSKFCFIKSKVLPSQRQNNKNMYNVWTCLEKELGWVLTANCSCMAGLGSACSHVAALLSKLEAASRLKLHETPPTSILCTWKKCKKSVQPASLQLINFQQPQKIFYKKIWLQSYL